ncbi:MAG: hypothetical protein MRQ09_01180 [Candidatus Midichloria sp.]|nr:hypothetical protein [Candidatus Midichloria sp.]
MPNKAINESKELIRAAFASIGLSIPMKRVTVNLSPADLLKEGSHFDLAIAIGLLIEMNSVPQEEIDNFIVMGELSLDGRIARIPGVLPAAIKANAKNLGLICSQANDKMRELSKVSLFYTAQACQDHLCTNRIPHLLPVGSHFFLLKLIY